MSEKKNPNLVELNAAENGLFVKLKRHNKIIRRRVFEGSPTKSTEKFCKWIKAKDRFKEILEKNKEK